MNVTNIWSLITHHFRYSIIICRLYYYNIDFIKWNSFVDIFEWKVMICKYSKSQIQFLSERYGFIFFFFFFFQFFCLFASFCSDCWSFSFNISLRSKIFLTWKTQSKIMVSFLIKLQASGHKWIFWNFYKHLFW